MKKVTPVAAPVKKGGKQRSVDFERVRTADELAQIYGEKTKKVTAVGLSMFAQLGGLFFLCGSLILSYLEALNIATLIPQNVNQFWQSWGISVMSILFSIIGFLFFTRWLAIRRMLVSFPLAMKKELEDEGEEGKKVYKIAMEQLNSGVSFTGWVALVFLSGNLLCSGFTVWTAISAMNSTTSMAQIITTGTISFLAFFAGACITMISSSDMDIETVTNNAFAEYAKTCRLTNMVNNIANFQTQP